LSRQGLADASFARKESEREIHFMTTRILLSTTSYQDTPGSHHELLESQGWEIVRERGPLSEEQMLALAGDFDGFLCGDDAITAAVIDKSLPRLKWISKYGIGLDKIDKEYVTSKGIPIGFTPGVNHTTVAEHTFGLMLGLTKKIFESYAHTSKGEWKRPTGNEIMGKRLGVIGMGRIGKEVLIRANAFGMHGTAYDLYWDEEFAKEHGVHRYENVDDAKAIASMKKGAVLINCARGEIIDTQAVVDGLNSGKLGGYGADVLDVEPPPVDHPLFSTPNTAITTHIGSRTYESVVRQATKATQNLINFVNGEPAVAQANEV
jgi:D-3-phosphoglycerate dehydrogenase